MNCIGRTWSLVLLLGLTNFLASASLPGWAQPGATGFNVVSATIDETRNLLAMGQTRKSSISDWIDSWKL